MTVQVVTTIEECVFNSTSFENTLYYVEMNLGQDSTELDLSKIRVTPECGFAPLIESFGLEPLSIPEDISVETLMSFDMNTIKFMILRTEDYNLIGQSVSVKLLATTSEGMSLSTKISVNYKANGPWLDIGDGQSLPEV